MRQISLLFIVLMAISTLYGQQKNITVDYNQEQGVIKDLMGVNKGPSDKLQGYLDAGIRIVRGHDFHGPCDYEYYSDFWNYDSLTENYSINTNFDPADPAYYHWQETDKKLDSIFIPGMDVYFRIGTSHPQNMQNKTPPLKAPHDTDSLEFTNFARLCKRTVMHCNGNWANGLNRNVKYWEIWNEPGGAFWKGTPLQFYKMYKTVYDTLKSYDTTLKVGTPGSVPSTTVGADTTFREGLLKYLKNNNGQLDFYSWHLYAYENPYSIKMWCDSIHNVMNKYGFINAESIISEVNYELGDGVGAISDSPKGTAYYMSSLITANESPVDKLFWYVGLGFFDADSNGQPNYKYSGYALKNYSLLLNNTPIQLESLGDEVIENNWKSDTTNLMTLAGKSNDQNKVYLVISNFNSQNDAFNITFNNLPWTIDDKIVYTKNCIKAGEKYTETQTVINGGSTLNIDVLNMPSPSVTLIRLEKNNSVPVSPIKGNSSSPLVYPNPANESLHIVNPHPGSLHITISDITGTIFKELTINESNRTINISSLPAGTYLVSITGNESNETFKIVKF
jgi:hypothetical protein